MASFKNKHLSVSRIKRYEQCPLSFKLSYIDKKKRAFGAATDIGKFLHLVLEHIFQWVIDEEYIGAIDEDFVKEVYDDLWVNSEDGMRLSGVELYEEGLEIIAKYVKSCGIVDAYDLISTEHAFNIVVEADGKKYTINGIIDRVDVRDGNLYVVDYKSNRIPFAKSELETDLQMSLYTYAAKKLWPKFAKSDVFCEYHMIRLGYIQRPSRPRTDEECETAIRYMIKTAQRTENPDCKFPPNLNAYCCYCDQADNCNAYQNILEGKVGLFKLKSLPITSSDLRKLSEHREAVSSVAGISYKRKKQIDELLRARLEYEKDIPIGDLVYYVSTPVDKSYDTIKLLEILSKYRDKEEIISKILVVRKESLKELLEEIRSGLNNAQRALLSAKIASVEERTGGTPRINVRKNRKVAPDDGHFKVRKVR